MLIRNPRALRGPYPDALRAVMSIEKARQSRAWLMHWSGIGKWPTPLWFLPDMASKLGVAALAVKDESARSPLGSFKALGAPIALLRLILRRWPDRGYTAESLFNGRHENDLAEYVVVSATDGNHGRALAAAARSIGCRCVIVLHKKVSLERERLIAALGARIVRIEGNYDDSVAHAAKLARDNDWQVVSDTSYEGYEAVPRDVMQGYAVIADELVEQAAAAGSDQPPFTHLFLQGGVGGLAAGVASYLHERYGRDRPTMIVVEPAEADCLYQTAANGKLTNATGATDSIMAGLACGEASPLAWRFLDGEIDAFALVQDDKVPPAMQRLAKGSPRDIPILAGESGVAGLVALMDIADRPEHRAAIGLDGGSRVAVINTEGDTAPDLYRSLTGRDGAEVLQAQGTWRPS
ncbi:MAG: diaminopropionate ammonia-lyase [Candidimonas sp.]|jgi:diaminopropionate ammonia-lyase family